MKSHPVSEVLILLILSGQLLHIQLYFLVKIVGVVLDVGDEDSATLRQTFLVHKSNVLYTVYLLRRADGELKSIW